MLKAPKTKRLKPECDALRSCFAFKFKLRRYNMAMLNVGGLTFVTGPLAFGIAANIRVGNLLGGGEPAAARVASIISVAAGTAWMVGPPPTVPNSA
jgi:hypothetical protein